MSEIGDLSKMKVADLKKLLKERNLPVTGNKTELVERLSLSLSSGEAEDEEIDEAKILGEDGDDADADKISPEEEESVLSGNTSPKKPAKKISLKRSNLTVPAKEEATQNGSADSGEPDKKKIKLISEEIPDTEKDKTEEKENDATIVPVSTEVIDKSKTVISLKPTDSDEARRLSRQLRFGTVAGKNVAATKDDLDKMKKRAERFGEVTAPALLSEIEIEKKKKRAERFGEETVESAETDEQKKKREERFGTGNVAKEAEEAKKAERAKRFATTA